MRNHLEGIIAWARERMTNGGPEAVNGLCQAAKRKSDRLSPTVHYSNSILPDRRITRLPIP
jgi:hypothetical protein